MRISTCVVVLFFALLPKLQADEQVWHELSEKALRQADAKVPKEFGLFSAIFLKANPAVVNISTLQLVDPPKMAKNGKAGPQIKQFLDRLPAEKRKNLGSGTIIRDDGLIVTNYHVVRKERGIAVTLADGRLFSGKVLGSDELTDLALIKIEDKRPLPTIPLSVSPSVDVGEWVLAIGNPFGFHNTMTHGIVSARGRVISPDARRKRFDNFIQIDASINPGNSGGPLLNLRGEVIGVNTAITAKGAGIAFAITIDQVKRVTRALYVYGYVPRGWLGFVAKEIAADESELPLTLKVIEIVRKSPAASGGLQVGDLISRFNSQRVGKLLELSDLISNTSPGTKIDLEIFRQGKRRTLRLTIDELKP